VGWDDFCRFHALPNAIACIARLEFVQGFLAGRGPFIAAILIPPSAHVHVRHSSVGCVPVAFLNRVSVECHKSRQGAEAVTLRIRFGL
jgi:hypothetical protein